MRTPPAALLDASAILALLFDEQGANAVTDVVSRSLVSTVNWVEVSQRLLERGAAPEQVRARLVETGLRIEPLGYEAAERAAALRAATREVGLSLADRCCLAIAELLDAPVLTADSAWRTVQVNTEVKLIR